MNNICQKALEFARIGLFRFKLDGTVISMDHQAFRILELDGSFPDPHSVIGKNISELISTTSMEELTGNRISEGEAVDDIEFEFKTPGGNEKCILLNVYSVRHVGEKEDALQAIIRDITKRKQMEESLQESELRFRSLYENATVGLYRTSINGRILMANPALVNMLGYSSFEELAEKNLEEDGFDPGYPRKTFLEMMEEKGEIKNLDSTWKRHDNTTIYVRESSRAFRDDEGNILYIEGTVEDITERKLVAEERRKMEERMQQVQKLESLGILAGGIAHDFNNLLLGILGNTEIALMDLVPGSPTHESLKKIESIAQRAADLTKQMLAYSGKGQFVIQPIDVSRLVEEMTDLHKTSISRKALLEYNLARGLPAIEADAAQVQHVIMNLLTNASEALGNKQGTILISTGVKRCDLEYLKATYLNDELLEGDYVFIEVTDDGCGMDKETITKIFDPFFTTKFTGRGLGLASVLGIMRGHHGAIRVESKPWRGSTFTVLFPASSEPIPEEKEEEIEEIVEPDKSLKTILVVDDEESVRMLAKEILERSGFKVLIATDGMEAVEVFGEHSGEITAVLLDLLMPNMSGEEAYREIMRIDKKARIILTSGYSEQEATSYFEGKKLAGFIQKPYRLASLVAKLNRILQ